MSKLRLSNLEQILHLIRAKAHEKLPYSIPRGGGYESNSSLLVYHGDYGSVLEAIGRNPVLSGAEVELYPLNVGSAREARRERVGRKEDERASARAACGRVSLLVSASATSNVFVSHDSSV